MENYLLIKFGPKKERMIIYGIITIMKRVQILQKLVILKIDINGNMLAQEII